MNPVKMSGLMISKSLLLFLLVPVHVTREFHFFFFLNGSDGQSCL